MSMQLCSNSRRARSNECAYSSTALLCGSKTRGSAPATAAKRPGSVQRRLCNDSCGGGASLVVVVDPLTPFYRGR
jgi:hypothetical protein